jgi:DNA-binding MarR family transcriptional regulator
VDLHVDEGMRGHIDIMMSIWHLDAKMRTRAVAMVRRQLDRSTALVPLIIADIYHVAGALRRNAEAIAQPLGQSQARWQVLSAASAEPKTVPQIARRLGIARQNVQRVADLLIADSLMSLAANPDHKTSVHLLPTAAGRAVLGELTRAAQLYYADLAAAMSDAQLAALRRGLRALSAALERGADDPEPPTHGGES